MPKLEPCAATAEAFSELNADWRPPVAPACTVVIEVIVPEESSVTESCTVPKRYLMASPVFVTVAGVTGVTGVVSGGVTGVTGVTGVVVPPEVAGLLGLGFGVTPPELLGALGGVVGVGAPVVGSGFAGAAGVVASGVDALSAIAC